MSQRGIVGAPGVWLISVLFTPHLRVNTSFRKSGTRQLGNPSPLLPFSWFGKGVPQHFPNTGKRKGEVAQQGSGSIHGGLPVDVGTNGARSVVRSEHIDPSRQRWAVQGVARGVCCRSSGESQCERSTGLVPRAVATATVEQLTCNASHPPSNGSPLAAPAERTFPSRRRTALPHTSCSRSPGSSPRSTRPSGLVAISP